MFIDNRLCSHCGQEIIRRANERPSTYAKRVFCSVSCLGQSKSAQRFSRFCERVDMRGPDDCWPWKGRRTERGYGEFSTSEKVYRAHRLALRLSGVDVPADRLVMHSCDNPPCCNPRHLKVGTYLDNNRDMIAKGRDRQLFGKANSNGKLSDSDKAAIRARRGEPLGVIAADFRVAKSTICRVQRNAG